MKFKRLLAGVAMAVPVAATASWFGTEFSAETVRSQPQQPPLTGRMYVGKSAMRLEMQQNGRAAVQIMDPVHNSALLLFPDEKVYMQAPLPPNSPSPGGAEANPCAGLKTVQCRQLGEEQLNGRHTIKWELSGQAGGQPLIGLQWQDVEHKFPVRVEQGGKVMMERRFLGPEAVNGRQTEKWESAFTAPDGKTMRAVQWYDPKLNVPVREEFQGGASQELRNIQEGSQPDTLFALPEGYRKVDPPPQQQSAPPGMPR